MQAYDVGTDAYRHTLRDPEYSYGTGRTAAHALMSPTSLTFLFRIALQGLGISKYNYCIDQARASPLHLTFFLRILS